MKVQTGTIDHLAPNVDNFYTERGVRCRMLKMNMIDGDDEGDDNIADNNECNQYDWWRW